MAERARHVTLDAGGLTRYAERLLREDLSAPGALTLPRAARDPESRCAFALTLNCVNFGSGWFPQLVKLPGRSGYRTIEARLVERFETRGPLGAGELEAMTPERCAALFGQPLERAPLAELMALFARGWRDLGRLVRERGSGRFAPLVDSANRSARSLVALLLEMPLYRDAATYDGLLVPFLKRAQLSVGDLALAAPGELGRFVDLDSLTLCADNLVPHVLRIDGVLRFDSELAARIDREELIPAGSAEEVEIRAVAVHATELLAARLAERGRPATPRELDYFLWTRGAGPRYKSRPRHRTRCPFY